MITKNKTSNVISWNQYFMALAKLASIRSGCNSRKTGAVIVLDKRVIATGYNGNLSGLKQCSDKGNDFCLRRSITLDDQGEKKYQECPSIHAEQNAINQIAKYGGVKLEGAVIYCTLFPCIFCLKNIVSTGIKKIYYEIGYQSDDPKRDDLWEQKIREYGIEIEQINLIDWERELARIMIHKTSIRKL